MYANQTQKVVPALVECLTSVWLFPLGVFVVIQSDLLLLWNDYYGTSILMKLSYIFIINIIWVYIKRNKYNKNSSPHHSNNAQCV